MNRSPDAIFPRASADFIRRNPGLFGGGRPASDFASPSTTPAPAARGGDAPSSRGGRGSRVAPVSGDTGRRWPSMNRTEARCLARLLESVPERCVFAQPCRFFALAGGGTYTPDFLVVRPGEPVRAIEVKGGYRGPGWEQGVERYRRAALEWSDGILFQFEMHTWDRARREWRVDPWP